MVMPGSWVEGEESAGEERMQRDKRQVCLMSQRALPHLRVRGHKVCWQVKGMGYIGIWEKRGASFRGNEGENGGGHFVGKAFMACGW